MRTCVIFNPAAKGDKARRFRAQLDTIATQAVLKQTAAAGDARRLAAEAIAAGCDTVIAAGGDGTINEVLNGIADADAFHRVRLGVLPLGTVNVFARELKIPTDPAKAWKLILRGRYTRIDLCWAEFSGGDAASIPSPRPSGERARERGSELEKQNLLSPALSSFGGGEGEESAGRASSPVRLQRQHFMQMAGAGLDARAIELVDWQQKKKIGPLAYVVAGLKALREPQPQIIVTAGGKTTMGRLVLIGNGKLYGGGYRVFPEADLRNGLLEVCVFPQVNWPMLFYCGLMLLVTRKLPEGVVERLRAAQVELSATPASAFELDGEWAGRLPVRFGVEQGRLRVIVP